MNSELSNNETKNEENNDSNEIIANPHTLWKQITGILICSIIIFPFTGLATVAVGILTFIDAWKAGIYKNSNKKKFTNLSPMGWGIGMMFIFIVVFPIYLINRNKLKTKDTHDGFYIATILIGLITILLAVLMLNSGHQVS